MIDILKIPDSVLYDKSEMESFNIRGFLSPAYQVTEFGGVEFITKQAYSMLQYEVSDEIREYRSEFFDKLMTDMDFQEQIKRIMRNLPNKRIYMPRSEGHNAIINIERLINLPETLEEILKLDNDTQLVRDLQDYAQDYLATHSRLMRNMGFIAERAPSRNKIQHNLTMLVKLCQRRGYNRIVSEFKELREQLTTYVIFAYLCQDGCKPIIEENQFSGRMAGAFHLGYAEQSTDGIENWTLPVINNINWGPSKRFNIVSGGKGKTAYLQTVGLNVLLSMNGFYALANRVEISPVRKVWFNQYNDLDKRDLYLMDEPAELEPAKTLRRTYHNCFISTQDQDIIDRYSGLRSVSVVESKINIKK